VHFSGNKRTIFVVIEALRKHQLEASGETSLPCKITSTAQRFAQDVLHFLDQLRRGVGAWEARESLQRFARLKPLVIKKAPENKNLHFPAFGS
jgi:hypothetical protein